MNTKLGVYGREIGCTQYFEADGTVSRVTVIHTGPTTLVNKRTKDKDGYTALVLGIEDRKEKHTTKAQQGAYKKWNTTPKRILREVRVNEETLAKFEVGQVLKLDDVFETGQLVDVQGKTRGRGFTGVMRRWNFAGQVTTHGTHEYKRHGGSIGTNMTPGRTLPNLKMPGHYGNETVSVLSQKLAKIDAEKNLLFILGAVPGSRSGVVLVRHAVKARVKKS